MKPIAPIHHEGNTNYREVHDQNYKVLRGNVSFGDGTNNDNIKGAWGTVGGISLITMPAAPNTEQAVIHNLGYIPNAYDVKYKDRACDIYDSGTAWTKTTAYFKCTIASAKIRVFIH